jgi:hypothetical protein
MKKTSFAYLLFLSAGLLNAKDIPLDTPTVVTGKVSSGKLGFYISNEDTVSGPGNGFKLNHEPVHHFLVSLDSLPSEKQKVRNEELRKAALRVRQSPSTGFTSHSMNGHSHTGAAALCSICRSESGLVLVKKQNENLKAGTWAIRYQNYYFRISLSSARPWYQFERS